MARTQELFSIGDVAQLFHLSVSSLRHYETIGLLTPEYTDPATGYRYYGPRQFEVLNTIRYLRALDMPLGQIRAFLRNRDVGRIEQLMREQKAAVVRKQEELQRVERKIDNRLRQLREAQTTQLDVIKRVDCGPCRLFWLGQTLRITDCSHLQSPERYRRLMDYIRANHLRPDGFSREITLIDYGLTNDTEKFVTEITIPVREA